jgi:hypothetical protein
MANSVGMASSALTFAKGVKNGGNLVLLHHGRVVIVELVSTFSPPGCAEVTVVSIDGAGVLPLNSGVDTVNDMLKLVSLPLLESMVVLIPVLASMLIPLLALSLLISLVGTAVEVPPDSTTDPPVVEACTTRVPPDSTTDPTIVETCSTRVPPDSTTDPTIVETCSTRVPPDSTTDPTIVEETGSALVVVALLE